MKNPARESESEAYREPIHTLMLTFVYSHYTVQSVFTSEGWITVAS